MDDIIISFATNVGTIKALNINEDESIGFVNKSFVMSLKNKKFPQLLAEGENINNRDTNRRFPPLPPSLIPVLSSTYAKDGTYYKMDVYASDRESSIAGYFFYGYAAITNLKVTIENNKRTENGTIETTGEVGSLNLHYSYFVPYGFYEGSGGTGSYSVTQDWSTDGIFLITRSEYSSSYEGRPSNYVSESSSDVTGTTVVFELPYRHKTTNIERTTQKVIFRSP